MDIKEIIEKYRLSIGLSEKDFYINRKPRNAIFRNSIMYWLHYKKGYANHVLSIIFRKDHTSVMYILRKYYDIINYGLHYEKIAIEQIITSFQQSFESGIIDCSLRSELVNDILENTNYTNLMKIDNDKLTEIYELIKGFENGNINQDISFRKSS